MPTLIHVTVARRYSNNPLGYLVTLPLLDPVSMTASVSVYDSADGGGTGCSAGIIMSLCFFFNPFLVGDTSFRHVCEYFVKNLVKTINIKFIKNSFSIKCVNLNLTDIGRQIGAKNV